MNTATPVQVQGLANAVEVRTGFDHSCARFADGSAACWGSNPEGQLGNGSIDSSNVPVPVTPF
jgi:alpha-tubulin suppressor-like RCC1 family protein